MTTEQTQVAVLKLVNNLIKAGEELNIRYAQKISVGTNLAIYAKRFQSTGVLYRVAEVYLKDVLILEGDDAQFVYDEVLKLKVDEINNILENQ